MYNWSVDEIKFNNPKEILRFLKQIPEVIYAKILKEKDKWGNRIIKTKLVLNLHPAKKTFIQYYLQERIKNLQISILENK